jgi:sulfur relay (sulfurtransferase) DsrC/TusE family protein
VSPTPDEFWNAWHTEPALRELAERWLTQPDGERASESVELYRLIDHDPDRAMKVIFRAA